MSRTAWTADFDSKSEPKKIKTVLEVCKLETINSVTKDDLLYLLRWLAAKTIVEETE